MQDSAEFVVSDYFLHRWDLQFTKVRNVKSPTRGTEKSAGIDFFIPKFDQQCVDDLREKNGDIQFEHIGGGGGPAIKLFPQQRILIPSGIHVNVPADFVLIAHNKSGVASKKGLDVLACVVDEDYQGEVHISLVNTSRDIIYLSQDDKIIQFILIPVLYAKISEVPTLQELYPAETERGAGGFGSTDDKGKSGEGLEIKGLQGQTGDEK